MTTDTQAEPRSGSRSEPQGDGPEASAAPQPEPYVPAFSGTSLFARRGRHRRPRPRRILLAIGGLALAVGALSLVRLAPESGVGGAGGIATAEAGPRSDPDASIGRERATRTAADVPAAPEVSPSATSALGGVSTTPVTRGARGVPASSETTTAPARPAPAPDATTIPDIPNAPAPTATAPRPAPTPPPARGTPSPSPKGDGPGLCVPVVGLCVDSPADRDRRRLRH